MQSGAIKESLHTFIECNTKRKLEEAARRKYRKTGEIIDMLVAEHIRKDGVII